MSEKKKAALAPNAVQLTFQFQKASTCVGGVMNMLSQRKDSVHLMFIASLYTERQ